MTGCSGIPLGAWGGGVLGAPRYLTLFFPARWRELLHPGPAMPSGIPATANEVYFKKEVSCNYFLDSQNQRLERLDKS